jgi:hypothetical protein
MTKVTGSRILAATPVIAGLAALAYSLGTGAASAAAYEPPSGQLHIVKDCGSFSGVPGDSFCMIVSSNLNELPVGSRIYYDQISAGPAAGPGYLDSNTFIYVRSGQWAVGRCTIANDNLTPGLCTISDGSGALAHFFARIVVTYKPGGDGALYAWDGTYSFN